MLLLQFQPLPRHALFSRRHSGSIYFRHYVFITPLSPLRRGYYADAFADITLALRRASRGFFMLFASRQHAVFIFAFRLAAYYASWLQPAAAFKATPAITATPAIYSWPLREAGYKIRFLQPRHIFAATPPVFGVFSRH